MKDVLVISGEEENAVGPDGSADGAPELLLAVVGLETEEGRLGAEAAVAQEVEAGAVHVVGTGFGNDVDHRSARATEFGSVGVGGNAEFLDNFVGELIGGAITPASLPEEGIVVVGAVNEVAGLVAANAAEGEVAVRGRGESARVLGHAGSQQ